MSLQGLSEALDEIEPWTAGELKREGRVVGPIQMECLLKSTVFRQQNQARL